MELDARTASEGTVLEGDVCIVGAGPVGLSLAQDLQRSGLQVVLIESGGDLSRADEQELNTGETVGDPYMDLHECRARAVGGTSSIWNTLFQESVFAKYVPLDPLDFESRDGASAGWPFPHSTLDPYYRKAHTVCGLGPFDYAASTWSDRKHPVLDLPEDGLTSGVYQMGPAAQFTQVIPTELRASETVTLVSGATVIELRAQRVGERISEAHWATLSGQRGVARADHFVLAAGGIENARLLLLFRASDPPGGSSHSPLGGANGGADDWLGRGFMEHPIDRSIELVTRTPALCPTLGFYGVHEMGGNVVVGRIGLSPELLREEGLPNASLRPLTPLGPSEPQILRATSVRSTARRLIPFAPLRRLIGNAVRSVRRMPDHFRPARYRVLVDLEHRPHRDNRVRLSDRRDAFGQPKAVLCWHWRDEEQKVRERLLSTVVRELERAGLGQVHRAEGQPVDPNHHHHAGTTRMHPESDEGVVDEDLRVHGMENLFVAGSSVFPTAGWANPTLTAIALTLRLADHISGGR